MTKTRQKWQVHVTTQYLHFLKIKRQKCDRNYCSGQKRYLTHCSFTLWPELVKAKKCLFYLSSFSMTGAGKSDKCFVFKLSLSWWPELGRKRQKSSMRQIYFLFDLCPVHLQSVPAISRRKTSIECVPLSDNDNSTLFVLDDKNWTFGSSCWIPLIQISRL